MEKSRECCVNERELFEEEEREVKKMREIKRELGTISAVIHVKFLLASTGIFCFK